MSPALAIAVHLNHCYVAPDRATFDAAAQDPFLSSRFASFEQRTTRRTDHTYTGLYYYGDHTYFELLEPGRGFGSGSAIAFGVEEPGAIARLGKPHPITREAEGRQVAWFHTVSDGDAFAQSDLSSWIMECDPRFLAQWYPALPPAERGIQRKQLLDRYVAHTGRPRGLFQDLTRVELVLAASDLDAFAKQCERFGYRLERDGLAIACTGPEVVLHLTPGHPPARLGIAKVTFRLRGAAPKREAHRLGTSTLELDGDTAVWRFN